MKKLIILFLIPLHLSAASIDVESFMHQFLQDKLNEIHINNKIKPININTREKKDAYLLGKIDAYLECLFICEKMYDMEYEDGCNFLDYRPKN